MSNHTHAASSDQNLLEQAGDALQQRQFQDAVRLAGIVAQRTPQHPGAHYILGLALLDVGQVGRSLEHLKKATGLASDVAEYATHFARALVQAQRHTEAIQVANIAASLPPAGPLTLDALGMIYMQCQAHERAYSMFRRVVALLPDDANSYYNLGISQTFGGDLDAAEASFDECLRLRSAYWTCYALRSRVRRQTAERNHIYELRDLIDRHRDNVQAQVQLHSALGKEYEDLCDWPLAFEHYSRAKSQPTGRRSYRSSDDAALVDVLIDAFPATAQVTGGYSCDEPIFVVGMPRSGTTLVDRILCSHPEVYSAGELSNFGAQVHQAASVSAATVLDPRAIAKASQMDFAALGRRYVASTRPQTTNKPRFVDKLPHNFLFIGFIAQALPRSKIICLRRNPMDTCLSNFRELFMEQSPYHGYSFDLMDIGRFYIQFDRLMAHWRKAFPGRLLEIDYEAIVARQEESTRTLLDHCELPWNAACMRFEQNPSASATASTAQVRQPLHADFIDRWKHYGDLLSPLEKLLKDARVGM